MHKIFLFILLIGLIKVSGNSQSAIVNETPEIAQMMRTFVSKNKTIDMIRGYRIQIITTDDRREMERARSKFASMYPDIPMHWEHISPYYKVQIGAYENKLSLQGFLLDLKEEFPTAIPVMDDLYKSELVAN